MICRTNGLRSSIRLVSFSNGLKTLGVSGDLLQLGPQELAGAIQLHLAKNEVSGLKTIRNKLQRHLNNRYPEYVAEVRRGGILQPDLVQMIFFTQAGSRQYQAFVMSLESVISSLGSVEVKRRQLYTLVQLQKALFPQLARKSGILLPESAHQWFWRELPKNASFEHFQFLIQNHVLLGSEYANRFLNRLLKGSEMDQQLATFQIFLHEARHEHIFSESFTKVYTFAQIIRITASLLSKKDFRHIKHYFTALLERMEKYELQKPGLTQNERITLFIKFTSTLLKYFERSHNQDMFIHSFKMVVELVRTQKLDSRLLHRPFLLAVKQLRLLNEHSHVLKFISLAEELNLGRSFKFRQSLIGELVATLRSFNDPKLILGYITAVYTHPQTVPLLNELGIWGLLHHNSVDRLTLGQLKADMQNMEGHKSQLSMFLTRPLLPNTVVLTELYRTTLQDLSSTTSPTNLKQLIIDLYHQYMNLLKAGRILFPDTGILKILIYHLRYTLKEDHLTLQLLLDFYQNLPQGGCRNRGSSPFGLVIYHNYTLTRTELSSLLVVMDAHKIKLDFKVICSLVFHNLRSGQVEDAKVWYDKIVVAGFPITHKLLIKRAFENDWQLPKDTDVAFLNESDTGQEFDDVDVLSTGDLIEEEIEGTTGFANELLKAMGSLKRTHNIEPAKQ
ncbi:LADA_0A02410g1_1 [Lachancea dasiensis]|uniref:LADA_0A02410g1_1 n=1 Tax=Lachancea dasiensis TaxID=1072105 RepID=A0A1G4IMG1_9SACH|nr:LADA_0A02410g1_1 [Lachancea dasiensis]